MATNITCRLPESILPKLDFMAQQEIGGNRCRSPFLDILLKSFKVQISIVPRNKSEKMDIEEKEIDPRKMMTFSMSTEAIVNLKTMSNQTGLSQSQCIDFIVNHVYNEGTEGEE
tara:strand:+ start:2053 stop:2394 length:342 start_codon:yes stop_codon:yes gene_type:complete